MGKWGYIAIALLILVVIFRKHIMNIGSIVKNFLIRRPDKFGNGAFGAKRERNGKEYIHQGVDIVVKPGEPIYAPFDLRFIRTAKPYVDDNTLIGGVWDFEGQGIEGQMKIFYMTPLNGREFKKGEVIGYAQNVAAKYGAGMTNHIHLELRDKMGNLLNPEKYV